MSDTTHPRIPGTHRVWTRADRYYEETGYSEPKGVKQREWQSIGLNDTAVIAEGLADYVEDAFEAGDVPDCDSVTWDHHGQFLDWDFTVQSVALEPDHYDLEDEVHYGDPADLPDPPEWDDEEPTDWTPWLPTLSYDEACEELNYGFTIEGPSPSTEPLKRDAYVRVYELARQLEVDSKPLVAYLRGIGEYVLSHQSWVALPVARRLSLDEEAVASLGERTTESTPAQRWEAILTGEARTALLKRLGAY